VTSTAETTLYTYGLTSNVNRLCMDVGRSCGVGVSLQSMEGNKTFQKTKKVLYFSFYCQKTNITF